jgi:hypothetical protein
MDDITQLTKHATDAVKTEAKDQAQAAIGAVAVESKALAGALRCAADQAQHDGARVVQEPLRQIADLCQRFADKTADRGMREVFAAVEDFGRRQPLAFFGAAAAVGYLGTRALRAAADESRGTKPQDEHSWRLPPNAEEPNSEDRQTDPGAM